MKKLKKLLLCVFMFLISFTMFGCASVNLDVIYAQKQDVNGNPLNVVTASMSIAIDKSISMGIIQPIVTEYFKQLNEQYEKNIVDCYSQVYPEVNLMYSEHQIQEKFKYMMTTKPLGRFLINDNNESGIKVDSSKGTINIKREFVSIYGYIMYFYPSAFEYNADKNAVVISDNYKSLIDIPIGGGFEQEEKLFTIRSIQYCTPFYYNGKEPYFFKKVNMLGSEYEAETTVMSVLSAKTGKKEADLEKLGFSFSTPYKRVHSDGTVSQTKNGYTHSWTLGNIGSTVSVWRTYANSPAWYVIAGCVGILMVVIGFIVVKVVNDAKKKRGMKALKQLDQLARQQEQEENKNDK